jgi:two-component system sensor histidine kinase CiaH
MSKKFWEGMNFSNATIKLAATYLAIIMAMSIGFSLIFYQASANQFDRPFPPKVNRSSQEINIDENAAQDRAELIALLEERSAEARDVLQLRILYLNVLALFTGSLISYLLARWSLRPIEASVDAQSQFVSDASHELRTPLTVLQTTNEVALRKKKISEKSSRELIAYNIEETKKLQRLSSSLLDLLKGNSRRTLKMEVELQDVIAKAMENVVDIAQEKKISIKDMSDRITLKTEPELLVRLLSILLDNAVKYSEANTFVTIAAEEDGKVARISVIDQGIGIKASDLPHIFRRFYRADKSRTSQDAAGYGLGLSIAEKIADQIDVKLSVKSHSGEGSTFTITLQTN